jgi:hypothetical protein
MADGTPWDNEPLQVLSVPGRSSHVDACACQSFPQVVRCQHDCRRWTRRGSSASTRAILDDRGRIALELGYALDVHRSALFVTGLLLMVVVVILVFVGEAISRTRASA